MLFDTWKRLIKGIVLRFYREKIQKHVAVRVAETVKPLLFDYVLNGQLFMETICSVPSHTINDVCTGIRSQFITEVELINFLRIQRKREMRHLPVLGQFH